MSDDSRIEIITKLLIDELIRQGYNLKVTHDVSMVHVVLLSNGNKLMLDNPMAGWEIDCGTYVPKVEGE
jgi:hypothetical protein